LARRINKLNEEIILVQEKTEFERDYDAYKKQLNELEGL
jgi:hypothetical protein